jgi:hypothetical protein
MLSPVLLYALLAIIDLESEGDMGDDYVLSCGHLAGGNSISSILLVEFCSGAKAIPIESMYGGRLGENQAFKNRKIRILSD